MLTDLTNVLVVHERAEAERAHRLPALSRVPHMLAAGWAGAACAVSHPKLCLDVHEDASFDMPVPPPIFRKRGAASAPSDGVGPLLRALDRTITTQGIAALPAMLDDLERLGLPLAALDELRALVTREGDERTVVDAFLAALASRASRFGTGRHLVRALRRRSGTSIPSPDVIGAVEAVVTKLESKRPVSERLVEALRARSG